MLTHSLTGLLALVDTLVYEHVSTCSGTQIYLKYHVHIHDSAYEFTCTHEYDRIHKITHVPSQASTHWHIHSHTMAYLMLMGSHSQQSYTLAHLYLLTWTHPHIHLCTRICLLTSKNTHIFTHTQICSHFIVLLAVNHLWMSLHIYSPTNTLNTSYTWTRSHSHPQMNTLR